MKNEPGPLSGTKIAVTRPLHQSDEIKALIESHGGEAILAPTIEIVPKDSPILNKFIDDILENRFDYLVFLSVNSVICLLDQANKRGIYPRLLENLDKAKILCIGEKTRKAIQETGVKSSVSDIQTTEGVIQCFGDDLKGINIGIPRSSLADETLRKALESRGAKITEITTYITRVPRDREPVLNLIETLIEGEVTAVTFTSSSTAENLLKIAKEADMETELREALRSTKVVAIGPKTSQTIEEMGIKVDIIPSTYSIDSMIDALVESIQGENRI